MRGIMREKNQKIFVNYIIPLILLVYPLIKITQGIDLTDSCYGLVNYRFFPNAGQEWTVATYLANVLGALFMRLPFGDTLIGMRFYTGLMVSAMALFSWYFLKGKMPAWIAFAGELIAISLCWIPTTSLYNYLTFALFLGGSICLYRGLIWHKRPLMVLAGICLGANVLTRLPNIVECLLIVMVFYYGWLEKKPAKEIWLDVLACVGGFLGAFAVGFGAISLQFGIGAYGEMLFGLSGYQSTDETYSAFSMVTSIINAYITSFKWVLLLAAAAAMGCVMFWIFPGKWEKAKMALYICMLPVLLRLLWGRGMFSFQYAFYWSVFQWCMVLLYGAIGFSIWAMADPKVFRRDKLLALLVLLIIVVTPIGSNNETYPNMNNLFLVAPVTMWFGYQLCLGLGKKRLYFPIRAMLVFVLAVLYVQSAGFGLKAVFRDSIEGQVRDSGVTGNEKLAGVKTNAANAQSLQDVVDFVNENLGEQWRTVITFGDVPGFSWLFDMPSALSHDWPDMNTYPAAKMQEDLDGIRRMDGALPVVMIRQENIDFESAQEVAKWQMLQEFLQEYNYVPALDNGTYQIYMPQA